MGAGGTEGRNRREGFRKGETEQEDEKEEGRKGLLLIECASEGSELEFGLGC